MVSIGEFDARRVWRLVALALATAATCIAAGNGLVSPAFAPALVTGLIAGLAGALIAEDVVDAAIGTAAGVALALLTGLQGLGAGVAPPMLAFGAAVFSAVVARYAVSRSMVRAELLLTLGLLLVIANMWMTAVTFAQTPVFQGGKSEFSIIAEHPTDWRTLGDSGFYRNVVERMRAGSGYYEAYSAAWPQTFTGAPTSVFQVREPALFTLWAYAPGWPRSAFFGLLLLTTLAICASPFVLGRAVPAGYALFGATALAACQMGGIVSPFVLFLSERWTGALAVVVVACVALARSTRFPRAFVAAAAVLAVVAVSARELMIFLPVAGLVGAVFADARSRRYDLLAWAISLTGSAVVLGVHWSRTTSLLTHGGASASLWLGQHAGPANLYRAVVDQAGLLGPQAWVALALAVLGVTGALVQPDREYRWFAAVAVLLPLAGFVFVGNDARENANGVALNYWGAIVVPVLVALAPAALAALPGVGAPWWRPEGAPGSATDGTEPAPRSAPRSLGLRSWARPLGALLATAATCVAAGNGLIYPAYLPAVQLGLLGGIAAALVADEPAYAAASAALGALVAFAVGVAGLRADVASIVIAALVAGAVAGLVRLALARRALRESLVLAFALLLILADVWLTGVAFTSAPFFSGRSELQVVAERPAGAAWNGTGDAGFYRDVVWRMRDGAGYYQAYKAAWPDFWNDHPQNTFQIRQPWLSQLWAHLPGWPFSALLMTFAMTSLAAVAAPFVLPRAVPAGFGVMGAAAVAAYLLGWAFAPAMAFLAEPWAGAVGVAAVAAFGLSRRSARGRAWLLLAVALSVVAVATRELMVFLLVAGIIGALLAEPARRRFELWAWGGGCAAVAALFGAHWLGASSVLSTSSVSASHWLQQHAGLLNLYHGIVDQADLLSPNVWVAVLLVVAGVLGAALQPDRSYRGFALFAVAAPYLAFLVVSNDARGLSSGQIFNYWGAIVTPLALAMSPAALALLPGLRGEPLAVSAGGTGATMPVEPKSAESAVSGESTEAL